MIKRYPNLFVKLFLIIIFTLLCLFISSCAEAEANAAICVGHTDAPTSVLVQPEPYQYIKEKDYSVKIKQWEEEYYYTTKVWKYLRQKGFNQEVTCAIIGNMMIETSGGSLELKPYIYSPSGNYYGLCQWSKKYYPEAHGLSFEQQLEFLLNNAEWEINTFGKKYKDGFKYKDFLAMDDPAEAALAFAKSYERCGSASYEMRQVAALEAYEYFNLED
jgi:hypothetical protein